MKGMIYGDCPEFNEIVRELKDFEQKLNMELKSYVQRKQLVVI